MFDKKDEPTGFAAIGRAVTAQMNKVTPPAGGSIVQQGPLGQRASDFDIGMGNAQRVDLFGNPVKK